MKRKSFVSLVKIFTIFFVAFYTFSPVATAALAFDPGTPTPCNIQIVRGTPVCFSTIKEAVDASQIGETITVSAGTYVLDSVISFDTPNVTLEGIGNPTIQVSGTGYRMDISAAGITVKGFNIVKTDKTGEQNIVWVHASNTSLINNEFRGQFVIGDSEVSRAIVISGGFVGLLIQNNIFHDLRQPGYISGVTTGTISNNYTYKTKGWVVEQGNMLFSNNTWGNGSNSNVYDIAILSATSPAYYTDIAQMSLDNNHAFIEDQRTSPATLSVVYVDGNVAVSGDGTARSPKKTINEGVARVIANDGIIYIAAGTYEEQVSIDSKNITLVGAGSSNTYLASPSTLQTLFTTSGTNKPILYIHNADVDISGITVDGLGRANGNYRMVGIAYYNASGSLKNSNIVNIKETPASGNQQGNALYIYSDDNQSRTVNVDSVSIHDYQKNGAVFAGNNLTVNISNSVIMGLGQISFIAQNGIQYSNGATGTIDGNIITDNYYTPANWSATGILLYGAGANLKISNNELSNNGWGALYVYGAGDGLQILDNNIHNNLGEGIDLSGSGLTNAKILGNILKDNDTGMWVDSDVPSGLLVYDNTFDNPVNVEDSTSINYDNGSSRGNFWNNYTGLDLNGDGIGETSYSIDSDSQDRYPQTTNLLSVKVNSVLTNKVIYKMGDVLAFDINVTNTGTLPFTTANENLVVNITNPSGAYISGTFRQSVPLNLAAGETKTITFYTSAQTIPNAWTEGTYRIHVSVYSNRTSIGYLAGGQYSSTTFKVDTTNPTTPTNLIFKNTDGSVLGCNTYTNQYTVEASWNPSLSSDIASYEYRSYNPTTGWVYGPVNVGLTTSRIGSFTVGNGTYGFAVRAVDFAGNTSDWTSSDIASSCKITYDNIAPTTPVNGTPNGKTIPTNNFDFNWDSSTDNSGLTYEFQSSMDPAQVNGVLTTGIWSSGTLPLNMIHSAGAPDGTWYWQVRAKDAAGNYSPWSEIWTVKLDTIAPSTPILISPDNGTFTKGATVTNIWSDTSTDIAYYNYESYKDANLQSLRWNGTFTTTSKTATNVADATFWWRVQAVDFAGNKSAWSNAWKITVDNNSPIVDITSPIINSLHGEVDIMGTVTDTNPDHYWLVIEDSQGNIVSGPGVVNDTNSFVNKLFFTWDTTKVADGIYTIKLEARDKAGNKNTGSSKWVQVTVDNTSPVLGINTFNLLQSGPFEISGTATDNLSGIKTLDLDFGNGVTCSALYSSGLWSLSINDGICNLNDGEYNVTATAVDNNENSSSATISGLTIDKTLPTGEAAVLGTFTEGKAPSTVLNLYDNHNLSEVCYSLDNINYTCNDITGTTYSWDITSILDSLGVGDFSFNYYLVDQAGNKSDANTITSEAESYSSTGIVNEIPDTNGEVQGVATQNLNAEAQSNNDTATSGDSDTTSPMETDTTQEVKGVEDTNKSTEEKTQLPWWAYAVGGAVLFSLIIFLIARRREEERKENNIK